MRLAIVAAEFNREVTDVMVKRALARAEARGVRVTSVVRVPGVFEIPLAIERATRKPVGLGITGPGMTDDQAMARVDKGAEAVDVALAMHELLRGL